MEYLKVAYLVPIANHASSSDSPHHREDALLGSLDVRPRGGDDSAGIKPAHLVSTMGIEHNTGFFYTVVEDAHLYLELSIFNKG